VILTDFLKRISPLEVICHHEHSHDTSPSRSEGIHDVVGAHRGSSGHVVGVDEPFRVKEGQQNFIGAMDFGLDRARLGLLKQQLSLLLGLCSMEGCSMEGQH
jgi:hypothetical protein